MERKYYFNEKNGKLHVMKNLISYFLITAICLTMTACGNNEKKAYEASKAAYDNISIAYEITEQFGSDIYEAWRLGIYDDDEIMEEGSEYLAKELSLSEDEIRAGVAYTIADLTDEDWDTMSDEDKENYIDKADIFFSVMEDDLFSFCVIAVGNAYIVNGKAEDAQTALDAAKSQMKELSTDYSDYEHYPNLKGYFTTTSSFFDFCQNPTGSFEQVKDTINDYKNEARDYISDLDYIFEE